MRKKKLYLAPNIIEISMDRDISLVMTTEDTEPVDPGGPDPIEPTSGSNFGTKEDNSGIKENPFAR